jgi:hypothetical protein
MTTTTRYCTSCVRADERLLSDNRTKFDFVVACGLAELADEDGMGRPASGSGSASKELTMFEYTKTQAVEKMGEIPVSSQAELKSIALEEVEEIK